MTNLIRVLGRLAVDSGGNLLLLPDRPQSEAVQSPTMPDLTGTGVVSPPNPEDFKTSQAQKEDLTLTGIIKKNKERERENEVP